MWKKRVAMSDSNSEWSENPTPKRCLRSYPAAWRRGLEAEGSTYKEYLVGPETVKRTGYLEQGESAFGEEAEWV